MKLRNIMLGAVATMAFATAHATEPTAVDAGAWLERARQMYIDKNYNGAADQLRHIATMTTNAAVAEESCYLQAMCAYEQGEPLCIDMLSDFIARYPGSSRRHSAAFAIGNRYFFTGRYGEAVNSYNTIHEHALTSPDDAHMLYRRAYSYLRLAEYDRARADFNRLAAYKQYRDAAHFYKGYLAYVDGDYSTAMSEFDAVGANTELADMSKYYIAQIYFTQGNYDRAIESGEQLLKKLGTVKPGQQRRPGSIAYSSHPVAVTKFETNEFYTELNRVVGESYYHNGNDSQAKSYLDSYIDACGDEVTPMRSSKYILGVLASRSADYEAVIDNMNYVVGADDALAQSAYLYLGQTYVAMDNNNSAMMAFEKAMNMDFDRDVAETAFFNYAVALGKGSRTPFGRSIEYFEQFINRYPDSRYQDQVEGYLCDAYIYGNDFNKAIESINRIKSPSPRVLEAKQYVLYNLGANDFSNGRVSAALDFFTRARKLGDYNNGVKADCAMWIGECQYKLGKYKSAISAYKTYLAENKNKNNDNLWNTNYGIAYCHFQQKNYEQARKLFEKVTASNSRLSSMAKADAYNRIGDTYYYAKDYANAERYYGIALTNNASAGDYSLYQEAMMSGLQKQHAQKIRKLDRLMSEYPKSTLRPSALLEKAQAQIALGDNNAAAATFDRLVDQFPQSAEARKGLLQLAITYKNVGRESDALAAYKKVVSKYPSSEEAVLAVEDMKVMYAQNGNIDELQSFLSKHEGAPQIDVSELDRLAFTSAEKAYLSDSHDASKLKSYLKKYPSGTYVVNANYYLADNEYRAGRHDAALQYIDYVLAHGSDATFAEDALAMKGNIMMARNDHKSALETFRQLSKKAATAENRTIAQIGMMRSASQLGRPSDVLEATTALLANPKVTDEVAKEARYEHATALASTGHKADAVDHWKQLAKDSRSIYGARSAYDLAEYYYDKKQYKDAERTLNALIDAGTPHQYWLARCFILLSDVYAKQGNKFEAKEYLESLKSNYPGKETDIFQMIDSRLKVLK